MPGGIRSICLEVYGAYIWRYTEHIPGGIRNIYLGVYAAYTWRYTEHIPAGTRSIYLEVYTAYTYRYTSSQFVPPSLPSVRLGRGKHTSSPAHLLSIIQNGEIWQKIITHHHSPLVDVQPPPNFQQKKNQPKNCVQYKQYIPVHNIWEGGGGEGRKGEGREGREGGRGGAEGGGEGSQKVLRGGFRIFFEKHFLRKKPWGPAPVPVTALRA